MMVDEIKIYKNFNCFNSECAACAKKTHLLNECPKINYIPERQFLIEKMNCYKFQERTNNPRFVCKKKYHALANLAETKLKSEKFFLPKSYEEIHSSFLSFSDEEKKIIKNVELVEEDKEFVFFFGFCIIYYFSYRNQKKIKISFSERVKDSKPKW